jgi:hypothetical protein
MQSIENEVLVAVPTESASHPPAESGNYTACALMP